MDSYKPKRGDAPLHIYKHSQDVIWILMIGIAVFIVSAVLIAQQLILFICFSPIIFLAIWGLLSSINEQLAIYEDGLEYRIGNTYIFSRWEDLEHFESRGTSRSRIFGICSSKIDLWQAGNALANFLGKPEYNDFIPLRLIDIPYREKDPNKFIKTPLGDIPRHPYYVSTLVVDTAKFAETKFGQELLHYAPQLFEDAEEKVKNS